MVRFKWLSGDFDWLDYGGKWVSNRCNSGEFDYFYVIELVNMGDDPKYGVMLSIVAPSQVMKEVRREALESCGWEGMDTNDPVTMVEVYSSYGCSALVGQWQGNNAHRLLKTAKQEARVNNSFTFGFSLDRAQNAIGSSGWDLLRGDILAGLHKGSDEE